MSVQRKLEIVQARAISFLVLASAIALAVVVILVGLKSRAAACQEMVHDVRYPIFLSPDVSGDSIVEVILSTLSKNGLNARVRHNSRSNTSDITDRGWMKSLDTPEGLLSKSGYELLLQQSSQLEGVQIVQIRYRNSVLCNANPRELDINHNVDHDVVYSRRSSWVTDGVALFTHSTTLRTTTPVALSRLSQLQTIVPSLRDIGATPASQMEPLSVVAYATYEDELNVPLLKSGSQIPINLHLQQWFDQSGTGKKYWRVVLSTNNPIYERETLSQYHSLSAALAKFAGPAAPRSLALL